MLTGSLKEKYLLSKIKDNVVHAGHSQPPELLRVLLWLLKAQAPTYLSNSLLTVQVPMEIWVATVDGWIQHSDILKIMD
ncbi:UNVERIFIED_CONTAM: hypothetical protein GTU68_037485 [Idotea baltica]|nr:hypothetical protein [Idotea baltica]